MRLSNRFRSLSLDSPIKVMSKSIIKPINVYAFSYALPWRPFSGKPIKYRKKTGILRVPEKRKRIGKKVQR